MAMQRLKLLSNRASLLLQQEDVNDVLEDGKIRNSNGPMIRALAEKLGLEVGIYKDDLDWYTSR